MLIYSEKVTSRLKYIVEALLANRIKADIQVTSSIDEFVKYNGPKINYSPKKFSIEEFHIHPYGLLSQTAITKQDTACFEWNGSTAFFKTRGDIPFDILSAAFYLLSRYEEYLPHEKDKMGRFAHSESLGYKQGFLHLPLVNLWIAQLLALLQQKYPDLPVQQPQFRFLPTYDIDVAYKYKTNSPVRNTYLKLRSLLKGSNLVTTTASGMDIYDVYDWLDEIHQHHQLQPLYFFLIARHSNDHDRKVNVKSRIFLQQLRKTVKKYEIGLKASWGSFHDKKLLQQELETLSKITGHKINVSRQHVNRMSLPYTYRNLLTAGIEKDYSMGYETVNGFRASYTLPFYWYDLMLEEQTNLLIRPYCFSQSAAILNGGTTAELAAEELQHYHDITKKVNGELVSIFNNQYLTEESEWHPWRNMYIAFLNKNFHYNTIVTNSVNSIGTGTSRSVD